MFRYAAHAVGSIEYGKRSLVILSYRMVTVRLLAPDDAEQFKALRLLAVDNAPTAIWPTCEEELARSSEEIAARIRSTPTQAVFGAFESDVLIGITGVRRESLRQVNHKATIWGVFVNPSYRGQGITQTLLSTATAHAAEQWDAVQLDALRQCGEPAGKEALCVARLSDVLLGAPRHEGWRPFL